MKQSLYLIFFLPFFLLCDYTGSMYKPDDPSYKPPSFRLDTTTSNVTDGDTVSADTVRFTLTGNDEEYYRNQFRYQLDEDEWTNWEGDHEQDYTIELTDLPGGTHTITIEVCYNPNDDITDSTISFFRAVKPFIANTVDTIISVDAAAQCTLTIVAGGTGDLVYIWYHDSTLLDSTTNDSLVLKEVTLADTGLYSCHVSSLWGEATSPDIHIRVLFRVFYDGNENTDGTIPTDTKGYEAADIATVIGNSGILTRRGYTFTGWNTKADGSGDTRDSADIFKIDTANVTLCAEWEENDSFSLTYDGNGADAGDLPDSARMYRTGELIEAPGNSGELVFDGFTFTGWNTEAEGSGEGFGEGDYIEMGEEEIMLYAQWSNNPTFTVTYDENGADSGEVPVDAQKYEEDDSVTVAGISGNLVKEGNTFTGWNTEAKGDEGKAYTPGATFVMGIKNVTLYARWTTNPVYNVTYLGNGNTAGTAPDPVRNEAGVEVTIASQGTLVKKGYSFTGWNTVVDGSGKTYEKNAAYTIAEKDDTLHAQWEINRYTVTYNGNGDNVGNLPPQTTHHYNTGITLDTVTPTRTGYTFFRWNTNATGDGEDYEPGDEFTIGDGDATFYARWTGNKYTVNYNGNGNTGGAAPASTKSDYNDSVTIAGKESLKLTGYSFSGWNTEKNGGGTAYPADTVIFMGAEGMVLFAQWTINQYQVRFDTQGGSDVDSQYVDYNDTVKTPAAPKRSGYTFDGWYSDSSCINQWEFGTMAITADTTLYAKWILDSINATILISDTVHVYDGSPKEVTVITTPAGLSVEITYNDNADAPTAAGTYAVLASVIEANYTGTASATLTISKATPTITTAPTAAGITYGQTLASATLSGGAASVAGTFAFTTPTTAPPLGTADHPVTFTPTDAANYNLVAAGSVSVTVTKATSTITTAPTAAGITYGQTLASATLSGGEASVAGTFAFTTPATAPPLGTANHAVTFTPTDAANYNSVAAGSVSVTVTKATPTITTAPTAAGITYGQTLASATLSGGAASVAGTFAFTTPATAPPLGTADHPVTFTPTDAANYNPVAAGSVSVTVTKATPTITTAPTAAGITYGQTLASATLSGGAASVAGTFAFTTPTTAPPLGTADHPVTFTPTDAANYNLVAVNVNVTVGPVTDGSGNVYTTVIIGNQEWIVENLKTTRYRDGTVIPGVTDPAAWAALTSPGYCWYGNDSATYNEDYGILYNWYTVTDTNTHRVAPAGWHVPSDAEWTELEEYCVANGYNWDGTTTGNKIGKSLASATGWNSYPTEGTVGNDTLSNNRTGFSALPGGYRNRGGNFFDQSYLGYWWSATAFDASSAFSRYLLYLYEHPYRDYFDESCGYSVRLLRD